MHEPSEIKEDHAPADAKLGLLVATDVHKSRLEVFDIGHFYEHD